MIVCPAMADFLSESGAGIALDVGTIARSDQQVGGISSAMNILVTLDFATGPNVQLLME